MQSAVAAGVRVCAGVSARDQSLSRSNTRCRSHHAEVTHVVIVITQKCRRGIFSLTIVPDDAQLDEGQLVARHDVGAASDADDEGALVGSATDERATTQQRH